MMISIHRKHMMCSAIAIAEKMKSGRNIIVMTLAALRENFISELKKCGDPLYRKLQHWHFQKTEILFILN